MARTDRWAALVSVIAFATAASTPPVAAAEDPVAPRLAPGEAAVELTEEDDPTLAARLDDYLAPIVAAGHLSGTLLIARGDTVVFEESWGFADHDHRVVNRPDTRFCIASVTKPMTIALAALLIEQRRLGVEDSLERFVPGFPAGDRITVSHLLDHQAGIVHRVTSEDEETVPFTAADIAERARRRPLLFAPGERSEYSSAGFSVLARVLELAGGKPFATLLDEQVLRPCGMGDTVDPADSAIVPNRARPYRLGPRGLSTTRLKDLSFLVGAGSVWSTPRDLLRLQRAVVRGRLGPIVPQALDRTDGMRWNGVTGGFRCFVDHHKKADVTIVLCANLITGALDLMQRDLPRLLAGLELPPPVVPAPVHVAADPAAVAAVEGVYEMRPGSTMELRRHVDGLLANDWLLGSIGDGAYFSAQDYATVRPRRDATGAIVALDWSGLHGPASYPRVGPLPR